MSKAFFTIGEYGNTVSLYERGNTIYIRYQGRRKRLGRITQADARRKALAVHETLLKRADITVSLGEYSLRQLLTSYRREMTEHKGEGQRAHEIRVMDLARNVFDPNTSPSEIGEKEALRLHRLRTSGAIDAHGRPVPDGKRRTASDSTASMDLKALRRMFAWGVRNGHITTNRLAGIEFPHNPNPQRPYMTEERYEAMRKVAPQVRVRFGSRRKWTERESYFEVLLDLAWHTGHRISSIIALQEDDLLPDQGPHGAIRFRGETMKMKRDVTIPINREARAAIEKQIARERPNKRLFPSPMKPKQAVDVATARRWWYKAEELASLKHVPGGAWHMARRGWVMERKEVRAKDAAALGGWKTQRVMEDIYDQATFTDMVKIIQQRENSNGDG
ncbi:MAG: site-specific integrase [marine benthic group bacterium]|jgi:integrase|nr:site-specific integrase [Candidatus Benthicola marisminoris]